MNLAVGLPFCRREGIIADAGHRKNGFSSIIKSVAVLVFAGKNG
jgi:hypothetical protein